MGTLICKRVLLSCLILICTDIVYVSHERFLCIVYFRIPVRVSPQGLESQIHVRRSGNNAQQPSAAANGTNNAGATEAPPSVPSENSAPNAPPSALLDVVPPPPPPLAEVSSQFSIILFSRT